MAERIGLRYFNLAIMASLTPFTVLENLHEDGSCTVVRALREEDRRPVIVKGLGARWQPRDLERLRKEYEVGSRLDLAGVLRPLAFETTRGNPALVLEDFEGCSLAHLRGTAGAERFLRIASGLAGALAAVHAKGLVHGDVRPENALVRATTDEVRLIDLGLASASPGEEQAAPGPRLIEGSLPYLSPEQTGRTRWPMDARSDLYSLGITLYELYAGRLPFEARDPPGWVHCHLARNARPLAEVVPGTPAVLSHIVARLLAKSPEDRYQSALGLQRDLERCLASLAQAGRLEPFPLGQRDVPREFRISRRLLGRERELATLLAAFERVAATGTPELVLVSGPAGIGKSSVIRDLHRPVARERGFFLSGKSDPYKRDMPYSTIAQAFRGLVLDLLAESEERVRDWRERLGGALGMNGRLIVAVIPEVEWLVGEQPPVPDLPPDAAKRRFELVFGHFLGAFARKEHPLTLFLDDLQWADPESLGLLEGLLAHPRPFHLLAVGAYRDEEVHAGHPLLAALAAARKTGIRVQEMALGPLRQEDLDQLVAGTMLRPAEDLARLVSEKTAGNPLFAIQLLASLHDDGAIRFDPELSAWRCDMAAARAARYADNVVDLLIARLRRLGAEAQEAARLAACVGDAVDAATLALLWERPEEEAHGRLGELVREGLLERADGAYRFVHDRVRQAACSLIPEGRRSELHLQIGRRLLERASRASADELDRRIFDIVAQLDLGASLVETREERTQVAELNLRAARRAKATVAYRSAVGYLRVGAALIDREVAPGGQEVAPGGGDPWDGQRDLAFALHLELAECQFLDGACDEAERLFPALLERAQTRLERAAVHRVMIDTLTTEGRDDEAIRNALECLRMFGIEMAPRPTADEVESGFQEVWKSLGGRSIEELVDLPLMTDPEMQAAMEVLARLYAPAHHSDNNLFYLHLCHGVNLSLRHGNCAASTHAYGWFGITLAARFRRPAEGYQFARMALELMERHRFVAYKAKALFQMRMISYWTQPLDRALEYSRSAFEAAMETGDVPVACFSCAQIVWGMVMRGDRLAEVHREAQRGLDFVRRAGFQDVHDMLVGADRLVQSMRGFTRNPSTFDDGDFSECRFEAAIADRMPTLRFSYYVTKLMARFLAGDLDGALAAAEQCRAVLWAGLFTALSQCYHLYHALALAAACDDLSPEERKRILDLLLAHREELGDPALFHPATFRGPRALLSAEIARVRGDHEEAVRLYDEALRAAREGGFVQNEALVAELTSRFHRARGLDLVADGFLRHARACYARWGADGKVRQLDERHPRLVDPGTTVRGVFAAPAEQLDLVSVVKASQTISGEILVEELASTLLKLVLEQGGARKGYLLLARGDALYLQAEAQVEAQAAATLVQEGITTRVLDSLPLDSSSQLLLVAAVRQAQRTREPVILGAPADLYDPVDASGLASDPYYASRRPRSALCLPIVRREKLVGLLYLENDQVAGAFTPERLAALTLLASQAAISMENALLLSHERASRERAERATRALREGEERLRLAQDAAKAGIWEWDLRTNENFWSEGAWKLYGLQPGSVQPSYESWRATIHSEDRARAERVVQEAARSGTELDVEWRVLTPDGTTRWIMARGRPLRDAGGQVVRYLGISMDVTDRKRAEEALMQEDRRKSEFLGVLSHELRNPLAPIRNSTFILDRAPPGSSEAARAKEIINRQTEHLSRLVDDLLDVTRISRGKIELRRERLDLREIVRRTAEDLHTIFEQGEIRLSVTLPPRPIWVDADATRISQVVGNLLQNAAKFTAARGGVSVVLEEEAAAAVVRVSDNGQGIEPALLAHVFEPFVQAERGLARPRGGLGLGLALVKGLIELHGGSVSAASEGIGRGSQFAIRLPLAFQPAAGSAEPNAPRTAGARSILIIEDNPDAGQSLAYVMALSGHSARVARDGRSGLALAREMRPDVILCDIGLPDIDGYEIARTLRADWTLRSTRLIALSGYAQPGDKRRAKEAGFDAHLRKPPPLDELEELLSPGCFARRAVER